jgi:hypothetical protein
MLIDDHAFSDLAEDFLWAHIAKSVFLDVVVEEFPFGSVLWILRSSCDVEEIGIHIHGYLVLLIHNDQIE